MERREIRLSTAVKPYVFLTAFERREILGVETSDEVEDRVDRDRPGPVETERASPSNPERQGRSCGTSTTVRREHAFDTSPACRRNGQRNRNWTWGLENNDARRLGSAVRRAMRGRTCSSSHTTSVRRSTRRTTWMTRSSSRVKNLMFDYIDELKQYDPNFKDHYNLLEGLGYGPGLIDTFIDPYWYLDF